MSEPDEVRALSRLAARELGGAATGGVGGVHQAVAQRVFRAVGPGGRPVQLAHDAISRTVYAGLRGATTLAGEAADAALRLREPRDGRAISRVVAQLGDERAQLAIGAGQDHRGKSTSTRSAAEEQGKRTARWSRNVRGNLRRIRSEPTLTQLAPAAVWM